MSPESPSVKVLLPMPVAQGFDYGPGEGTYLPGSVVEVPLGRRASFGVVWPEEGEVFQGERKNILRSYPVPPFKGDFMEFLEWMARYTLTPKGSLLRMVVPVPEALELPKSRKKGQEGVEPSFEVPLNFQKQVLSPDQLVAASALREDVKAHKPSVTLLDGVTGSGKTEVYYEAIHQALEAGGQSLVLLPEIALSTQWLERFKRRFGVEPALWHSELTPAKRRDTWRAIAWGRAPVVVGARSALFLPYPDLRLIVVDEEHDGSYKQEEGIVYNARDMAIVRAHFEKIPCVLASATPSLETVNNVETYKYKKLVLGDRHGGAEMPDVSLIDMREARKKGEVNTKRFLSKSLTQALGEILERGEQAMVFLNRRGYAPLTLCAECGDRISCEQCATALVQHKTLHRLICHHCGFMRPIPKTCEKCEGEETFISCGPGVERVAEEVRLHFPTARLEVMTSDTLSTAKKTRESIERVQDHQVDFLIGTQIMAKGHHFPNLTLVGVVDGDEGLSGGDLRASERTYQLLHQVSGRSGREAKKGRVMIQTYAPEMSLMQALKNGDRDLFLAAEKDARLIHGMPPFGQLVALIISGSESSQVERTARFLASTFPLSPDVELLGPTPAPLSFLRGKHRWRCLVKSSKKGMIQGILGGWLGANPTPRDIKITVDVDPYSFF